MPLPARTTTHCQLQARAKLPFGRMFAICARQIGLVHRRKTYGSATSARTLALVQSVAVVRSVKLQDSRKMLVRANTPSRRSIREGVFGQRVQTTVRLCLEFDFRVDCEVRGTGIRTLSSQRLPPSCLLTGGFILLYHLPVSDKFSTSPLFPYLGVLTRCA